MVASIAPGQLIACTNNHVVGEVIHHEGEADYVMAGNWRPQGTGGGRPKACMCGAPFWREKPEPAWHILRHGWIVA